MSLHLKSTHRQSPRCNSYHSGGFGALIIPISPLRLRALVESGG